MQRPRHKATRTTTHYSSGRKNIKNGRRRPVDSSVIYGPLEKSEALAEVESRRRHIWLCNFPADFSNNEPEADEAFFPRVAAQIA
ncbi:MAG: hypothetical protein DWI23_03520 [Planctomycetota bacterium]|nr:MAG: hypothetical protein DWI23_03520 [Planctomycetota bacterium]